MEDPGFDTALNSRQVGILGTKHIKKLKGSKVLFIGMHGLSAEAAKNLILLGPGEVGIFDNAHVSCRDLGSNFALRED